jgi:phage terminase small subunit
VSLTVRPSGPPKAPGHLRPATRRWWLWVVGNFELEPHHLRVLQLAGENYDRAAQAREALAANGLTYVDRFGSPKARPEVAIARDAAIVFSRLLRELRLDVAPDDPRLPNMPGGRAHAS